MTDIGFRTGWFKTALATLAISLPSTSALASARESIARVPAGEIVTPASSQKQPGNLAHTNIKVFVPNGQKFGLDSLPSGNFETPASLACLYKLVRVTPGCNPQTVTAIAHSGSKVIILVDAFDYPTAQSDLAAFSQQFGLPNITPRNFTVVYASGTKPPQDSTGGWELEEALDIEMAHALAPGAKVILVEANSNSLADLLTAEGVAGKLAAKAAGGEVSNSWGAGETADEESYEKIFTAKNTVYFASAGDLPGVELPSVLSNVVGVGGTTVNRDANGDFLDQSIWYLTGGGISPYVPIPPYQAAIAGLIGSFRGVPDTALVADPATGVWIYDTTPYGGQVLAWQVVGGTSVASPSVAAIVNSARSFAAGSVAELTTIYANLGNRKDFKDVRAGECGNGILQPKRGWNPCTGVGTPYGKKGK